MQVPTSFRNFTTSRIYGVIITSKILGAEGNITKEANTYVEGSAQINSCSDHTIHLVQGGIRQRVIYFKQLPVIRYTKINFPNFVPNKSGFLISSSL